MASEQNQIFLPFAVLRGTKVCSHHSGKFNNELVYWIPFAGNPTNVKANHLVHGVRRGGAKRAFAPVEIGTKKAKLLENVKSAV